MAMLRGRADASGWVPPPPVSGERVPLLNHRGPLLGLTLSVTIFAWICSLLRLYTRFFILRSPWWDDLFIVLALIFTTAGSIILCILLNYGMGKHLFELTPPQIYDFMKLFYFGSVTYPLALSFIKLALLCQYLRIFEIGSRRRLICKWLAGIVTTVGLFFFAAAAVPCNPVQTFWDITAQPRSCWGYASGNPNESLGFYVSQSVTTAILDLAVFSLPLHLFFRVDTPRNTRIALFCLLALGLLVALCTLCRLIYSFAPTLQALWDLSWNGPTPIALAAIEINLACVCAALPVFWPVLCNTWGRIFVTYEFHVTREDGVFIQRNKTLRHQKPDATTLQLHFHSQLEAQLQLTKPPLAQRRSSETSDRESRHRQKSSRSANSSKAEVEELEAGEQPEWDPYVGDANTGLGDYETTVQSPARPPSPLLKGNANGPSLLARLYRTWLASERFHPVDDSIDMENVEART